MAEDKSISELGAMLADENPETMRAGKRRLWQLVRRAGRPGNDAECTMIVSELQRLTAADQPVVVRREIIWMLSEIAGDECVEAVAAMLTDNELREDARMVLQRLPGEKSLAALKTGFNTAPDEFKINIAEALRARGINDPAFPPDEKLKPTRQTKVTPAGR